jgi:hypothetical protein
MPTRQSRWEFLKFVDSSGGVDVCWPWTSACSPTGHGRFGAEGVQWYAHKLMYEMVTGVEAKFPESIIMHLCNNPKCCNPKHLMLGTPGHNMTHAGIMGTLSRPGAQNGNSKLTAEQVAAIKTDGRIGRIIAEEYGITKSQVNRIKRGGAWR